MLNGSMMADICDSDELASGLRREGLFSAVFAICYKAGIAGGTLFGNYLLHWSGVRGESVGGASVVTLVPEVVSNIRLAYLLPTSLCFLGAAVLMLLYPLTQAKVQAIRTALENRKSA